MEQNVSQSQTLDKTYSKSGTIYWRYRPFELRGHVTSFLAELWRVKRACGAPWVSKSTHPRTFGNHVTVHRPPSRTTGKPMFNLTLSCTHIAHQCYDQLTAVRTGYQLSSIIWPYRGLRCCPFEVEYVFEVIRWQVTSFQMIASSRLIFFNSYEICCVLYVPHN